MAHKFTGEVVIHCHILVHEDLGMMMTVEIVDEGEIAKTLSTNYLQYIFYCRKSNNCGSRMLL